MNRSKSSRPPGVASSEAQREQADADARAALASLYTGLPDPDVAGGLSGFISEAVELLCRHLEEVDGAAGNPTEDSPHRSGVAARLASAAVRITMATLTHARKHPEQLIGILPETSEWPGIISLDPTRDVRRVVRNKNGAVAKFYAPISKPLGKNVLFPRSTIREWEIFHELAEAAAENIRWSSALGAVYRLRDLPW